MELPSVLSQREQQILAATACGLTLNEIERLLKRSQHYISHTRRVLKQHCDDSIIIVLIAALNAGPDLFDIDAVTLELDPSLQKAWQTAVAARSSHPLTPVQLNYLIRQIPVYSIGARSLQQDWKVGSRLELIYVAHQPAIVASLIATSGLGSRRGVGAYVLTVAAAAHLRQLKTEDIPQKSW